MDFEAHFLVKIYLIKNPGIFLQLLFFQYFCVFLVLCLLRLAHNSWTLHSVNFTFLGNVLQTFYCVLKLKWTITFKMLLLRIAFSTGFFSKIKEQRNLCKFAFSKVSKQYLNYISKYQPTELGNSHNCFRPYHRLPLWKC